MQVVVRDNNVDQALRALKKKMQREGIFREMKLRNYYEKPSEKRAREKAEAIRRARKLARKKAQREGLVSPSRARPAPRRASAFSFQCRTSWPRFGGKPGHPRFAIAESNHARRVAGHDECELGVSLYDARATCST